jgi:hypothetical protein
MNVLLNAYEYWRYESKNTQTFEAIDANDTLRQSMRHGHSHGGPIVAKTPKLFLNI